MLSPRNAVRDIPAYHPPLAGRDGLRLDFNENTVGCSPAVLERLHAMGVDFAQGFLMHEPAPIDELIEPVAAAA